MVRRDWKERIGKKGLERRDWKEGIGKKGGEEADDMIRTLLCLIGMR